MRRRATSCKETVGYFDEDPRLFLVQTPHFFLNPDPLERNLRTFETMPSRERDVLRHHPARPRQVERRLLLRLGRRAAARRRWTRPDGFSGVSITEDCETALELHARGWNSIYVDKPLIAGLQPATFASFIGQRSRWAQGMMQILRFRFPLLQARPVASRSAFATCRRRCSGCFPFPRTIFLFAPLFYLFFDLRDLHRLGRRVPRLHARPTWS